LDGELHEINQRTRNSGEPVMNSVNYCRQCGVKMEANAKYCPECGSPTQDDLRWGQSVGGNIPIPPTQKVNDTPLYSPIETTDFGGFGENAAPKSKRNIYLVGCALGALACCALVGALMVVGLVLNDESDSISNLFSDPTATSAPPTATLAPTFAPAKPTAPPPQQTQAKPGLTGQQRLSETEFFDDFSSDELHWSQDDDASSAVGYEDGKYFMEVKTPDYRHLVYTPVEYLTHLDFSAEVVSGSANGAFGVICYWEDFDNHHYVYFDLYENRFYIGFIENGDWNDLIDPVKFNKPSGSQRYAVDCTPGLIAVYVNDQLSQEIEVNMPVQPAEMLLAIMGWQDAQPGGMKVLFDDIYGYRAMQ